MPKDKMQLERRNNLDILMAQLRQERQTFIPYWRDLADHIAPTRPRFLVTNANKGNRKNQKIIDSTGALASRTLRSGMMAGVTSPARPWFRLATPHVELNEIPPVKYWLDGVTRSMSSAFLKSNLYNVLPTVYADMGTFATGCLYIEEDQDNLFQFYSMPIGSYFLANDEKLRVRIFAREYRMTIRQLISTFGVEDADIPEQNFDPNTVQEAPTLPSKKKINWDIFSTHVRNQYEEGHMETWIDVTHIIQPNPHYDPNKLDPSYKMYSSVYYESGGDASHLKRGIMDFDRTKFLRDSGYDYFPVLAPRWETTGHDVYGTNCPGMESLGDIKQLQVGEKRTMQAIDKILNPPMKGPSSLKNKKATLIPGDITFLDVREGQQGFTPTYQVDPRVLEIENKQQQIRQRISRAFYEDLFLMMANSDRREITAREIDARQEERLLALGPVLEQLNVDLLDPLVDICFGIMMDRGVIPEPPQELSGQDVKVEYISVMAQAQKAVGIGGVERFANFAGGLAQLEPSVLQKLNFDQFIDVYGDMTSVPPSLVRSDEEVDQIRQAQQAQAQAQQELENMKVASEAAKNMGQVPPEHLDGVQQGLSLAEAGQATEGI